MRVLGIETSTMVGSLALIENGELLGECTLNTKVTHSVRLIPGINFLLKNLEVSLRDIDLLAVSIGPGSFTSLRIGVSTAKGLAQVIKKPIIGVPSLDAMASQLPYTEFRICPIIDARRGEVYTASYRSEANETKRLTPYMSLSPEKLLQQIGEKTIFLGDGLRLYKDLILRRMGDLALFAPVGLSLPKGASIARIALSMYQNGYRENLFRLSPKYVRKSDAEIKLQAKNNVTRME